MWETIFMLIIIIIAVIGLILVYEYHKEQEYKKTEYYSQTHNTYLSTKFNKSISGEFSVYDYLEHVPGYKKFLINLYLPKTNGGTTETDLILLHESGIYVFEVKNYKGWIFGTENHRNWTQVLMACRGVSTKNHFFNPILQNKTHINCLKRAINDYKIPIHSIIVFSYRAELKEINLTTNQHHVISEYQLLKTILQISTSNGKLLSPKQIDELHTTLYSFTQNTPEQKNQHINNIVQKRQRDEELINKLICPRCGGNLVIRIAKKGACAGNQFLGCSNYPNCRFTKNIQ